MTEERDGRGGRREVGDGQIAMEGARETADAKKQPALLGRPWSRELMALKYL